MRGAQFCAGVGSSSCLVELAGKVDNHFVFAGVVQASNQVHHLRTVFGALPAGDIVRDFGRHSGHERRKFALAGERGAQLLAKRGITLVQRFLPAVKHFKRVPLADFVHINAVAINQQVRLLCSVDELGFLKIACKESDFADEQTPSLIVGLDAGKLTRVRAAGNDRPRNHVRKRL